MRKKLIVPVSLFALGAFALIARADTASTLDAKAAFDKYCGSCHANGGNSINPAKPLHKSALEKNGVKSWQDGIAKMRNPGPGMTKFMPKDISDPEAKVITKYILATFQY